MHKIDWTKPVETLEGEALRVLCTDAIDPWAGAKGEDRPVVALDPRGFIHRYPLNTTQVMNSKPRIRRTVWLSVYRHSDCVVGYTSRYADLSAGMTPRVACIPIEIDCYEGDGL